MANSYSHFKSNGESSLKRKFRIWRCDIPRDNKRVLDRMRNPWIYLKLQKDAPAEGFLNKTEIHDILMDYYL